MKKKVLSVLLASTMVMSMAACGEQTTEAPATDTPATDTTTVAEPADDTTAEPAEVSELTFTVHFLFIYASHTAL